MRFQAIFSAALTVAALCGCVPFEQHRELELQLQKLESEHETCESTLHDERAATAAQAEHLRSYERELAAAQGEIHLLRGRSEQLGEERDQLKAVIEDRASKPLERPVVPLSPLPPELDAALAQFANKYQHRVWYDRDTGGVSFANDRLFESGSDAVRADAHAALHDFADIAAKALPEHFEVVVVGHTDDTPIKKEETLAQHPTNWHLSVHRAIAVKDVLVKAGLPAKRLGVMGYGPYRPVSDDRSRNRRVEIFLVRKGEAQTFAPVQPARG